MVEALVAELHGKILRIVCLHAGRHFQGSHQAVRALGLPNRMMKKLQRLADAHAVIRHIGQPYMDGMANELQIALAPHPRDRVADFRDGDELDNQYQGQAKDCILVEPGLLDVDELCSADAQTPAKQIAPSIGELGCAGVGRGASLGYGPWFGPSRKKVGMGKGQEHPRFVVVRNCEDGDETDDGVA